MIYILQIVHADGFAEFLTNRDMILPSTTIRCMKLREQ